MAHKEFKDNKDNKLLTKYRIFRSLTSNFLGLLLLLLLAAPCCPQLNNTSPRLPNAAASQAAPSPFVSHMQKVRKQQAKAKPTAPWTPYAPNLTSKHPMEATVHLQIQIFEFHISGGF